ncbi:hypothetical protein Sjap_002594 [Stephania japonica]|uniref:X8 domain-containing protein n=1 Tax=Stephania japonica TaxID=461633 RepID=A0AAP0KPH0_9MAGN
MDYACGEGGADCEQIRSDGSCYFPNNVFSHSSFAFNSYWQKNKNNGDDDDDVDDDDDDDDGDDGGEEETGWRGRGDGMVEKTG